MLRNQTFCVGVVMSILGITSSGTAADVSVTIENVAADDGFFFTPVWLGMHDGSFDLFDSGSAASSELETIAETGDAAPLSALFDGAANADGTARLGTVVLSPGGFEGAPVFDPSESVTTTWTIDNPQSNRYLSYASMVIPSNDAFFGNGNPMAYPIFDAEGNFNGPLTIEITAANIYDSGTEMNNGMGAAFSAIGGDATDEAGVVSLHAGLDNFLGTGTAAGTTVNSSLANGAVLARIQIVPEPSAVSLIALGLPVLGLLRRRQR